MKYKIVISLAIIVATFNISALNVVSEAGRLAAIVGEGKNVRELVISGSINAADFEYISNDMPDIESLDLRNATITEYSGDALSYSNRTFSAAGVLPEYSFFGSDIISIILPSDISSVGECALAGSSVEYVEIPAGMKGIESFAFAGSKIKEITIPTTVVSLGKAMMKDCAYLERVSVNSICDIPEECFFGCNLLSSVSLSPGIRNIGARAFSGAINLQDIKLPESLETIGDYTFSKSGLTVADLQNCNIKNIGKGAFENCKSLAEASLPESVKSLPDALFFGDANLEVVSCNPKMDSIEALSLAGNSKMSVTPLTTVEDGVSSVGDYAMSGMNSVRTLLLPKTLVYIGKGAMEGMSSLKDIYITRITWKPELGNDVWKNVRQSDATLHVDEIIANEFENDPQWGLFEIDRTTDVPNIASEKNGKFSPHAHFNGNTLIVESNNNIGRIAVYDISGRTVAGTSPNDTMAQIDLPYLSPAVLIVEVFSVEGECATIKLVKR